MFEDLSGFSGMLGLFVGSFAWVGWVGLFMLRGSSGDGGRWGAGSFGLSSLSLDCCVKIVSRFVEPCVWY